MGFHYLCQMSYNNHELWYSQACVNMHHNRDHKVSTEICNSRLNFHKHLRIQARTQPHERMTWAVREQEKCVTHKHIAIFMYYRPLAIICSAKTWAQRRGWHQSSPLLIQQKGSGATSLWQLPASSHTTAPWSLQHPCLQGKDAGLNAQNQHPNLQSSCPGRSSYSALHFPEGGSVFNWVITSL